MIRIIFVFVSCAALLLSFACENQKKEGIGVDEIRQRVAAYADVTINVDLSLLTDNQQKVVKELLAASQTADEIFWMQSSHDAISIREKFASSPGPIREYIAINYGPYDRIYDQHRFVGDGPEIKPPAAGFYPSDITVETAEKYLQEHPDFRTDFESQYTVIVRDQNTLIAVPYHEYYSEQVQQLSRHLKKAASFAENESLKNYLTLRAEAVLTDDYYASDVAWMKLKDNLIDIVIGPIEHYEDNLFNYKAAYEAAVMIKDIQASSELDAYKKHLDALEKNLPIEDKYKKPGAGSGNVLEVVNIAYFGGDYQAGIKTIAASLPNDEKVISEFGAKKQLYKNIIEAKFDKILKKIAEKLISDEQASHISRDAFVSQVLLHELSHTLGPDYVYGSQTGVRKALKEKYSIIEECKADVLGIYHLDYLKKPFNLNEEDIRKNYVTYIAGLIRSIRFGYKEAHGAANLIQFNWLEKEGVLKKDAAGKKYSVDVSAFHQSISKLATRLLMIEALGDYEEAEKIIQELGQIKSSLLESINRISDVPRDLDLHFAVTEAE